MFAGRNFKRVDLDPKGPVRVSLNIVADRAELLDTKPEQIEAHRNLVSQAYKLYGAHHYDHYDFLLALTDTMGGIGLEHHRSSANSTVPNYFTQWEKTGGGGMGGGWRPPRMARSSPIGGRCGGAAGSGPRIIIPKASSSGSTPTR